MVEIEDLDQLYIHQFLSFRKMEDIYQGRVFRATQSDHLIVKDCGKSVE